MARTEQKLTYADLEQTPDDGRRYEIIDGCLFVTPAPWTKHQRVVLNIAVVLRAAEEAGYGQVYVAPVDVVFDWHNVVEPDVLFISRERLEQVTLKNIQGPPNLVIEVLSSGTRRRDLREKLQLYERFGVPHYWVVDTEEETVRCFAWQDGRYVEQATLRPGQRLSSPLFPGIEADVRALFS